MIRSRISLTQKSSSNREVTFSFESIARMVTREKETSSIVNEGVHITPMLRRFIQWVCTQVSRLTRHLGDIFLNRLEHETSFPLSPFF